MTSHTESENLLPARSVTERHFYLMVLACDRCGTGPLDFVSSERAGNEKVDIWYVRCRSCRCGRRLVFDRSKLLVDDGNTPTESLPVVNPTDAPSELLDVGQWLALFYTIISSAAEQSDRKQARRLGYEATLCLEEALKFYGPGCPLPGREAFFTENSAQRVKAHPQQFTRSKLEQMRQRLPSLHVMQTQLGSGSKTDRQICRSPITWWTRVRRWFARRSSR